MQTNRICRVCGKQVRPWVTICEDCRDERNYYAWIRRFVWRNCSGRKFHCNLVATTPEDANVEVGIQLYIDDYCMPME